MNLSAAVLISLLAGTAGLDARANEASAAAVKGRELVKQLADSRFKVRDTAEKDLIRMGVAALDALKEGEQHPDLHVQERCRQLQPMIRTLTLQKRIDAFLVNRDGPLPGNLPFVANFIKATGDSKEARELYAQMLQLNGQMLEEAEHNKKKGGVLFTAYCQEVNSRMHYVPGVDYRARQESITKADVSLFFLLSVELKDVANCSASFGHTFLNAPSLTESLSKGTPATLPFRKLFLSWLEKEPQPFIVQQALQVAANAKMNEVLPLILKSIRDKTAPIYSRTQTALLLAKMGTKDHLKDLEPLLDDKTVVGNFGINNTRGQVQMRDVALALSIKLSGQKMSEYDFDVMKGNEDLIANSYIYCAFSSDEKRDAAHKKYQESLGKSKK